MFFHASKESIRQREQLKALIDEGRSKGLSSEEIGALAEEYRFKISDLFGSSDEAREFLGLSSEEYRKMGFIEWIS